MKPILEYLLGKNKPGKKQIKATDETIGKIVKEELDKLGLDADLNHIDTSQVTDMSSLFACHGGAKYLGHEYMKLNPDISLWDVSNVKEMYDMFSWCSEFNCDISNWDVHNCYNMSHMFFNASSFNKPIGKWNVENLENASAMFWSAFSFDQDLSSWNVKKLEKSQCFSGMFRQAKMQNHAEFYPSFKIYNLS